jgi:hypothetical protein
MVAPRDIDSIRLNIGTVPVAGQDRERNPTAPFGRSP